MLKCANNYYTFGSMATFYLYDKALQKRNTFKINQFNANKFNLVKLFYDLRNTMLVFFLSKLYLKESFVFVIVSLHWGYQSTKQYILSRTKTKSPKTCQSS